MIRPNAGIAACLVALAAAASLRAQILSESLLCFPSQTESVEYDNLAALRSLRNYNALKERFAGVPLEQLKKALGQLAIPENEVTELVMGSSPGAFYGLIGGTFSGTAASKAAAKRGFLPSTVLTTPAFCSADAVCVIFLEDSLAAFGTSGQLKLMLEARQGVASRLSAKRDLVYLINKTDVRAPVRGIASGSLLNSAIADALGDQSGLKIDWTQFSSNISAFGYSVNLDSVAHVSAILECKSQATAVLLRQMLGTLGGLQSMAVQVGKDPASLPFQNMQVSSTGNIINLKMDAPVPAA